MFFSRFCGDGPTVEDLFYWGSQAEGKKYAKNAGVTATVATDINNFPPVRVEGGPGFTLRRRKNDASQLLKDDQKIFKSVGGL
jgi:hypothetical protein